MRGVPDAWPLSVAAVALLALAAAAALLALRPLLASRRAAGGIPTLAGAIPVLGVGPQFAAGGVRYLLTLWKAHGGVVRLLLGGSQRVFLLDPGDFRQLWSRPDVFTFRTVVPQLVERMIGLPAARLMALIEHEGAGYHDQFVRHLQGAGLAARNAALADQLMASVVRPARDVASQDAGAATPWVTVDAAAWSNDALLDAGVRLVFGDGFDAAAVRQPLREFDAALPLLVALPPPLARLLLPRAFAARDSLADTIERFFRACGAEGPGLDGRACRMSALMAERVRDQVASGFAPREVALINLTMLWALHANTAPTLFWLLAHIAADARARAAVRAEVDALSAEAPCWWRDAAQLTARLDALPALTSATWEVLRLAGAAMVQRHVTRAAELTVTTLADATGGDSVGRTPPATRRFTLAAGELVCAIPAHHVDGRVFHDPDAFVFDRFMPGADGAPPTFRLPSGAPLRAPVQPFGGGESMCPGRFLALNEVRLFVALVAHFFDMEPAEPAAPLPAVDASRTGIGVLTPAREWRLRLRFRREHAREADEGAGQKTDMPHLTPHVVCTCVLAVAVAATSQGAAPGFAAPPATHQRFTLNYDWRFHYGPMNRTAAPCEMFDGRDIGTGSIAAPVTPTADACCAACAANAVCVAWDWVSTGAATCYLKDNAVGNVSHAGRVTGSLPPAPFPVAPGYDDTDWLGVALPHDYAINGSFAASNDNYFGYLPHPPAWYRKNFSLDASLQGGTLFLLADSAMRNARVWLNGRELGDGTPFLSGYASWGFYITDTAVFGGANTLAVYVDPANSEGAWWYEGAGLIRSWWLHWAPSPLHVPVLAGVTIRPNVTGAISGGGTRGDGVVVGVSVIVGNTGSAVVAGAALSLAVLSAAGDVVGSAALALPAMGPGAEVESRATIELDGSTALWSPAQPALYTLQTVVRTADGALADNATTRFGVRVVAFDAATGLWLNGERLKIKGFCQHDNLQGLGAALTRDVHAFRVAGIRGIGANGWRASHGPLAPELLDELDEQGVLVLAENRDATNVAQLTAMITRDRNHPSIFAWSLCNEVSCPNATVGRALIDVVRSLDPTRPATGALLEPNFRKDPAALANALDIIGVNYADDQYDTIHASYPSTPMFASETSRCMIVRGVYQRAVNLSTIYSGDACMREFWTSVASRDYMAGIFVWVSADFMGEPKPVAWPQVAAIKGSFDAVLLPKDTAWQYRAWWADPPQPLVHVLPHWTWSAGEAVEVWAYTSAASVELFVDGVSHGRQSVPPFGRPSGWNVTWLQPGNATAVGYDAGGAVVATDTVVTAGPAAAVDLVVEKGASLVADGQATAIVTVCIVDARGVVVPTSIAEVDFALDDGAAGTLAGGGSGDPLSHEHQQGTRHAVWAGLGRVWLRAGLVPGAMTLHATSPGLAPASLRIPVLAPASPILWL